MTGGQEQVPGLLSLYVLWKTQLPRHDRPKEDVTGCGDKEAQTNAYCQNRSIQVIPSLRIRYVQLQYPSWDDAYFTTPEADIASLTKANIWPEPSRLMRQTMEAYVACA